MAGAEEPGDTDDDDATDEEAAAEAPEVEVGDGALMGKRDGETYAFLGILLLGVERKTKAPPR